MNTTRTVRFIGAAVLVAFVLASCATLKFDATGLDLSVSMTSVLGDDESYEQIKHFRKRAKASWLLGVLPLRQPDLRSILLQDGAGADALVNVQVTTKFRGIDVLITMFTGGVLHRRTVIIEGDMVEYTR